jgi:hypothetical protein
MALVVLLGAAGLAVDVGYHQYRQRIQQTATDSAAIAGGQVLASGNYVAAAQQDASNNGFTDGSSGGSCVSTAICVQVFNPPEATDAFAGRSDAVEVVITSPNPTFFEKMFGFNTVPIRTKAVAISVTVPSNNCFVTLSGPANFNSTTSPGGTPTLNAPDCGLTFNGGANFNNGSVNADFIGCAATCSNGTFTNATPTPIAPVSDPCPSITQCSYLSKHPPTCDSLGTIANVPGGGATMTPGCYTSANMQNLTNKNVTLGCGLYVIQTTLNISATGNHAPVNISQDCGTSGSAGVTFYIDTGGSINMRNANINLSAPTSGDYTQYSAGEQNALFYQVPSNTSTAVFQSASCAGCSSYINGMMYFPNANLNFNASLNTTAGTGVLIIAGTANFNGSLSNLFGAPGRGPYGAQTWILGE